MPSKAFDHFLNQERIYGETAHQTPFLTVDQSVHAIFFGHRAPMEILGQYSLHTNPRVPRDGEN